MTVGPVVTGTHTEPAAVVNEQNRSSKALRDVPGKEREKNGNGKETGKERVLSFPVPPFLGTRFFSRFWPKS